MEQKKEGQSASAGLIITTVIAVVAVQIVLAVTGLSSVATVLIAAVLTSLLVVVAWAAMGRSPTKEK